ncbi:hypothetical protein PSTG_09088 [Puccinia striiformis f. sp. tritici PST-78]|uniref:Uncharacterized protein n=1 Tax=Puccinia striiformis f. sp. tritici PST-78 TaxID=1165861 RepID=A0A0L0VFA1_9BASI|nr:hypothetical protein PSTG_09088 [Puccinia striiformis f. sp. tritici PST-78]
MWLSRKPEDHVQSSEALFLKGSGFAALHEQRCKYVTEASRGPPTRPLDGGPCTERPTPLLISGHFPAIVDKGVFASRFAVIIAGQPSGPKAQHSLPINHKPSYISRIHHDAPISGLRLAYHQDEKISAYIDAVQPGKQLS